MSARLAVLISGTGRNLAAILDACAGGELPAQPVLVLSNRPQAAGLALARARGVPVQVLDHQDFSSREAFDAELARRLAAAQPDVVALAGFMRILTPGFIDQFSGRLLNIHPSLLPRHRGLNTHQRVLDAGESWHGASVHFVTQELDAGAVIKQGRIAVQAGDTAESLAERVLHSVELKLFPEVLSWAAAGRLHLANGQAILDGAPLLQPLIGDY